MSFFNKYVALVVDAQGRDANVLVEATNWGNALGQLEEAGCEVVENQTSDYDPEDLLTSDARAEVGVIGIDELLTNSNFLPHP
jgi:hypothetical protein